MQRFIQCDRIIELSKSALAIICMISLICLVSFSLGVLILLIQIQICIYTNNLNMQLLEPKFNIEFFNISVSTELNQCSTLQIVNKIVYYQLENKQCFVSNKNYTLLYLENTDFNKTFNPLLSFTENKDECTFYNNLESVCTVHYYSWNNQITIFTVGFIVILLFITTIFIRNYIIDRRYQRFQQIPQNIQ